MNRMSNSSFCTFNWTIPKASLDSAIPGSLVHINLGFFSLGMIMVKRKFGELTDGFIFAWPMRRKVDLLKLSG